MLKRVFDILFSSFFLVFLSPFLVLISLMILINLGRPILFIQERPGLKGSIFKLIKFRTMHDTKDRHKEHLPDSERISAFGSFLRSTSLDELPELINVLVGSMSVVGPRPLLIEYLPLYSVYQMKRHNVRPGITGWSQINGRNTVSWEERFEHDIWYVENNDFILDLKIILKTFIKVIKRENIDHLNAEELSRFKGNGN